MRLVVFFKEVIWWFVYIKCEKYSLDEKFLFWEYIIDENVSWVLNWFFGFILLISIFIKKIIFMNIIII